MKRGPKKVHPARDLQSKYLGQTQAPTPFLLVSQSYGHIPSYQVGGPQDPNDDSLQGPNVIPIPHQTLNPTGQPLKPARQRLNLAPPRPLSDTEATMQVLLAMEMQAAVDKANAEIRAFSIDPQHYHIPTKEEIFGNHETLTAIITLLLDEASVLERVRSGRLPKEIYALTREWARMANSQWPQEMRAALIFFQKQNKKTYFNPGGILLSQ